MIAEVKDKNSETETIKINSRKNKSVVTKAVAMAVRKITDNSGRTYAVCPRTKDFCNYNCNKVCGNHC